MSYIIFMKLTNIIYIPIAKIKQNDYYTVRYVS